MSYPIPTRRRSASLPVLLLVIVAVLTIGLGITIFEGWVLSTILGWFGVGLSIFKSVVILLFVNTFIVNGRRSS